MKKAVSLVLCLSLFLLGLAACGKTSEEDTDGAVPLSTEPIDERLLNVVRENRSTFTERETRPVVNKTGGGADDLIYYFESEGEDNDRKYDALPVGKTVIPSDLLQKFVSQKSAFGELSFYEADRSLPFESILRADVTSKPENSYNFQLSFDRNLLLGVSDGTILLLSAYVRLDPESVKEGGMTGEIGFVFEEDGSKGTYDKLLSVTHEVGTEWTRLFYPVVFKKNYPIVHIRLGYGVQALEIGGFTVEAFEGVKLSDMPTSENAIYSDLTRGAAWREEAFERIEEIRKGDITVKVVDKNGAPIPNATVSVDMFEHEFEWGCGVDTSMLTSKNYSENLGKYFNSAVLQNALKWANYEKNPQNAAKLLDMIEGLGIQNIRGHCLVWDRKQKANDTSIPNDLPGLYSDRDAMMNRVLTHIESELTDVKGRLVDFDVLNEACTNTVMQDRWGKEIVKEWFDKAASVDSGATLYYNDYILDSRIFTLLDTFVDMDVPFEGIGIQSHYSTVKTMDSIWEYYEKLAAYGKRLKITEYDFACSSPEVQASFTRDLMILSFSHESIDGFYLWGMKGGDNNIYVCFDDNWNPRPALAQMVDLIYGKFWTNDAGLTDASGKFATRGFYGGYKLTVTAGTSRKIVSVDLRKGGSGDFTIVME